LGLGHADAVSTYGVDVQPLRPFIASETIADLRYRLTHSRLPKPAGDGWERGVPVRWLADLVSDWLAHEMGGLQDRLDGLPHLSATIDGQLVHLVQVLGKGPDPLPLVLTHGWPSSFLEHGALIPLLTDPQATGGDAADAFSVVMPSLPGFVFSAAPPPGGLTYQAVAKLWHRLMAEGLGYQRYGAHGSDIGAGVTAWLARTAPDSVVGVHLATPGLAPPPRPWTRAVEAYLKEQEVWTAEEGGYAHEHATKPTTLAAGLLDSPVGLAAWVGEKLTAWSAPTAFEQPGFPRQLLLDTLTLYRATGTVDSSLLPYWTYRHTAGAVLPIDDPSPVQTAISVFGGERVPFPKPPRELAERYFTLTGWTEHDRGGHFPAIAEPALLASILRDFFRPLRQH
jgi:pimeloyl-ACP methyl ester carboxylesterase